MSDPERPDLLVDRILRKAQVPGARHREALRRELLDHFDDARAARGDLGRVLRGFGDEGEVTRSLRTVYRGEFILRYLAKLLLSASCALGVAAAMLAMAGLRLEAPVAGAAELPGALRLAPGYATSLVVTAAVVLGLVAWREALRDGFHVGRMLVAVVAYLLACLLLLHLAPGGAAAVSWALALLACGYACFRVRARLANVALALVVFASVISGLPELASVSIGCGQALARSAALVASWLLTTTILAGFDRMFPGPIDTSTGGTT